MKILMLAEARNPHTIKWATGLASKGHEILIFSLFQFDDTIYTKYDNIKLAFASIDSSLYRVKEGNFTKIKFLFALPKLKKAILKFKPDILHAHYISSYGILAYLTGFHPLIISVWGNDIFEIPKKSKVLKILIKRTLSKSDRVLSTSNVMVKEISKYTKKNIEVTPFGVDLEKFKKLNDGIEKQEFVIGTIKTLEEKYGIEYLILAFKIVKDKYPKIPLKLLIVGEGSKKNELIKLVGKLNIRNVTEFAGNVNYDIIHQYHNMLSVSVIPSIMNGESFGVSVIESSACEVPVIVSNVGGLPEVVEDNVTGIIVEPKNPSLIANAIEKLLLNKEYRIKLGKQGRERVKNLYDFNSNLNQMINIYEAIRCI